MNMNYVDINYKNNKLLYLLLSGVKVEKNHYYTFFFYFNVIPNWFWKTTADNAAESDPDPSNNINMDSSDETDEAHNTEESSGKYMITYIDENENYSNTLMYV